MIKASTQGEEILLEILRALVFLSLGIPMLVFGLYGIILLYYSKQEKSEQQKGSEHNENMKFEPLVSVVVPTHNEELIISRRIENLLASNYPQDKLEIIFVDDSDDSTPNIIQDYSKKFPNIHLIRFHKRMGYSPCMIAGCKAAEGEIIVLGDAGSFFDTQTIPNLVKHFQTPNIGAVTGRDIILNIDEEIGKSEDTYQKMYNFLRIAESNMDSTFYIKGEATAVRKNIIADLESCNASFDTTMGLFVRQKGYKVIYDPQVKFYEYAPSTHSERVQQKVIRAANLIKVLFRFKSMIFKRRYNKFGCIILPMNLAMLVIAPVAILIGIVSLAVLTFFDLAFVRIIWGILGSVFLFFLIFSRRVAFTFLEFEYSILTALYQVFFTKRAHDKIKRVISTRR